MPISNAGTASRVPFAIPSLLPSRQVLTACKFLPFNSYGNLSTPKWAAPRFSRNLKLVASSASGDDTSVAFDASVPRDYDELLEQASKATQLALNDNKQLMEIEFPTAGLDSVPGDGEGGLEMTGSIQLIREFCDILVSPEKATRTRIFFPEDNEVEFARKAAFEGASFKLDLLRK